MCCCALSMLFLILSKSFSTIVKSMVPHSTESTSVIIIALIPSLLASVFVESPTTIVFPTFTRSCTCNYLRTIELLIITLVIRVVVIIEGHIPSLCVSFSPAPPWFTSHEFPEIYVIIIYIIPWVGSCSCVYYIDILPNF